MTHYIESAAQPFAPLIGVAPLMRRAFLNEDLRPLGAVLLARAQENPDDANAYLDCSTVLQLSGDRDIALAVQAQAVEMQALYSLPTQQAEPGLRLLVIMGLGDLMSNTPVEFLLEDSDVAIDFLYLTLTSSLPATIPEHDVLLVALAESDANQPLLQHVATLIVNWPRPVINRPEYIAVLSRDGVCAALQNMPGIEMPVTTRIDRSTLRALATARTTVEAILPGDDFPLIVRPIGSHAGQNLEKMATRDAITEYMRQVDAARFYASRFVDYTSADGQFRKYRIALIDGLPYLCHLAISTHWMVHYLNADMSESAVKRAEEARAMAHFDEEFAVRHATALQAIYQRMALPYLCIDCAETRSGELLIFEIDNAMVVHAMDSEALYPYKKPAMRKIFTAFRQMLENARQTSVTG